MKHALAGDLHVQKSSLQGTSTAPGGGGLAAAMSTAPSVLDVWASLSAFPILVYGASLSCAS